MELVTYSVERLLIIHNSPCFSFDKSCWQVYICLNNDVTSSPAVLVQMPLKYP
jgi:hypothetical protein